MNAHMDIGTESPRPAATPWQETVPLLSTAWVALALAMLFRDVHELFRPGLLDQMRTGVVNGTEITDPLMVIVGVGVLIVVSMPLVIRAAPWRIARRAVFAASALAAASIGASGIHDADDVLFLAYEFILLGLICTLAWRRSPTTEEPGRAT